ncbi:hypothetical protein MACK_001508 [Theileria orientalis]|uniref:Uncharacterized protein n=1 Tax=Theileria orientalis TaxID=68886 RepID=A0A976QX97_THEOR|nr:hypothetical protein MACK_001508 [Theileria orientalis]
MDSPWNHVTCRTDPPGVEQNVRDSGPSSQECELKPLDSSSHEKLVPESRSDLSQGPLKPIILDINLHLSTDSYDLYHVGDNYLYKAKNGYIFGFIKEDETIIWDPGPSDYATNVKVSGKDKVSILLENGDTKVFKRLEQRWYEAIEDTFDGFEDEFRKIPRSIGIDYEGTKPWKSEQENYRISPALNGSDEDVLAEKPLHDPPFANLDLTDPFNLEILTVGSGLSNDPTKYYFIKVDSGEGHYIFKSGVNCDQIKVNGVLIWKHSVLDSLGMYPKSVSYYNAQQLSINFMDDLIMFEKVGSLWKLKSGPKNREFNEVMSEPSIWQAGVEAHSKPANIGTHSADSISQQSSDVITNHNNNNSECENTNNNNSTVSPPPNPGPRRNSTSTVASDSSTTKLTPIHLDIKNMESTDTFKCIKKDGFAKYTPKEGHGFASVKKSGGAFSKAVEIWSTSEPKDFATAVVRDGTGQVSSMSNVTIFFCSKWKHLTKSDNEYLVDSDIRLFAVDSSDPTKTKQISSSQYSRTFVDDVFSFELNEDTKCSEVKYMYRSLETGESSKVTVNLEQVWKHDSKKHGNQYPKVIKYYWPDKMMINFEHMVVIHRKNPEGKWDEGHLFEFKFYTTVSNNLRELDATAYEYKEWNDEVFLILKKDANLAEVRHKGVSVWKHEPDKHVDKYPNLLSYMKDGSMVYIDFQTYFVLCKKTGGNSWSSNLFFIKFYSIDPNDETEFIELTASSFTIEEDAQGADFKMKKGSKCMLITSDSKVLWKHGPATDTGFYPTSIRYSRSKVLVSLDDSIILSEKDSANNWKKIEIPIKLYKRDPKDYTKFLELTGNEYNLIHQGENYKFALKNTANISMIKMEGEELWNHDGYIIQGPHPTSVIYAKNKKKLTVDYENYFMIYKKEDDGVWDKGQIIDMKLYARDSRNPDKSFVINDNHYQLKDEVEEFEFELKPHIKCTMVKLTGDEVWRYDSVLNSGKYPKRILYKRHKTIVSLVFDGFFVLIEKRKGSELWVARESITLDIALTTPTNKYTYEVHDLFLIYVPKENFLFSLVKMGDNVIYDPISPCDLASKVLVYKTTDRVNIVDLHLPGGIIKRYGKRLDETWYEKLTTLSLDLKMEANGSFFKCYGRGMGSYYTKKSFGFGNVVFGSSDIWKANNDTDYAYKVDVYEMEDLFDVHVHLKGGVIEKYKVNKNQRPNLLDVPDPSGSGSAASSHHVSLF